MQTNGAITLPLLGEVQVAGLTVAEIQRKITNLLAKDYLVNPQVEVKVREFQSQYVSVVGEVNNPGRKPLRGRMRLIDALIESGGFKATRLRRGHDHAHRRRPSRAARSVDQRAHLGAARLARRTTVNLELPLKNGDIITASPKSFVTVDGEVNKPGPLRDRGRPHGDRRDLARRRAHALRQQHGEGAPHRPADRAR